MTDNSHSAAGYASEERAGGAAVRDGASETAPTTLPARVGISEQVEEVGREIRQRERLYPKWIADRRLKPETADAKLAALRAAHATLQAVEKHADGLRLLIQYLRRVEKFDAECIAPDTGPCVPAGSRNASRNAPIISAIEAELLLQQPAVRAICAAFPEATLADVRAMETPQS